MKKHFYSLWAIIALVAMSGYITPVQAQRYCYPTFSGGGCSGNDLTGISVSPGSFSSSTSCTTSGVDTSGLSGPGITVYRGKAFSLTINCANNAVSYGAYIDYQHDGSFEDIGDFVGSDENGTTFYSVTQSVTIPIDAKLQTTRLRVEALYGVNVIAYNSECGSQVSGSMQDYKLNITAFPYDVGIVALTPAYCPNSKEKVQVIIRNIGQNTLTSIPFTFKVGSTTVNGTYKRSLASNTQDTFTVGTFDASTAGIYNVQVYANLSTDGDRSNDTLSTSLHIAQPTAPTVTSYIYHCGPGSVYVSGASTTPKTFTDWYTSDTSLVPIAKAADSIKTPTIPIGDSATYYAESEFNTSDTLTKGVFYSTPTGSGWRSNYGGNMFDVFAKNQVIIDSFDVDEGTSGVADSTGIWMRVGTYSGYQNDPKAWTHVATVPIRSAGEGYPTRVKLPYPITLNVGTTYGFYTYLVSFADANWYDITYPNSNPESNDDLRITTGCSLAAGYTDLYHPNGTPFTGAVNNARDWNGTIYYHLNACPSPRVTSTVVMLQNPNGATLAQGAPFQGKYNGGDEVHADHVCVADTVTYNITPPGGMTQADYGTKWVVNSIKFETVRGFVSKDTVSRMPTATSPGYVSFSPTASDGDSVFILSVDMTTPATSCDSVLQRYITVSASPVADFSFANPCGNIPIVFRNQSTIKSIYDTVNTWQWNFGDGSAISAREVPYNYQYASLGTYKVTLAVTSTAGCPDSVTKTLTEYPVPVSRFRTSAPCGATPVSFMDSSTISNGGKIVNWAWAFGNGDTSAAESPVYTYAHSGPYTVMLVTTSGQGCTDTLAQMVRIEPLPADSFTYFPVCVGSVLNMGLHFKDSSSAKIPTFTWDYGDGSPVTSSSSHVYEANGTYTVKLTATSVYGCKDSFSGPVTPNPETMPMIANTAACVGQLSTIADSSGAGPYATYTWMFGDSTDTTGTATVFHAYGDTGTYTVTLVLKNANNCTDTGSGTIRIPGYPKAGFTAGDVCLGNATVFANTSTGVASPGTYVWGFGDGATSGDTSPSHAYTAAGTYTVGLKATNQYGCADSSSASVKVNPLPKIAAWTQKQVYFTVNFVPADAKIGSFEWYFGDSLNDSSATTSPTFTYPTGPGGKYQVKLVVTNSFGCTSTRTDSVFTGKYNGIEVAGTVFDGITVFPNPFEGTTNVNYVLPARSRVSIGVYNAEGKLVATLKNGTYDAGNYTDAFDAKKYNAADGVYYLKMYINDQYYTTKIVETK